MTLSISRSVTKLAPLVAATALVAGCASNPATPGDPLEGYNRAMFSFNEKVDDYVLRPVAEVYDHVTPQPVRTGVGNFFGNLGDISNGINNLLQGKFTQGLSDAARFGVNTTVGILGLFDVATELGLAKSDEDFGQTLGWWGVGEGPYFVVPLLGPRTIRDAAALPIDLHGDLVWRVDHVPTRNAFTALKVVNTRANLLGIDKTLEEGTLDKYAYTRDFYLQQRRYKVHDGDLPVEYEDFDMDDEAALPPGSSSDVAAPAAIAGLQRVEAGAPQPAASSLDENR